MQIPTRPTNIYSTIINTKTCYFLGQLYVFSITSYTWFHSKFLLYKRFEQKLKRIQSPFVK